MKKYILILVLLLPLFSFGQGFYIKKYDVKMNVKKSGKVQVTERILVDFTEKKRGIIRKIPTLYYISEDIIGDKSTRAEPSDKNYIHIDNVKINRSFTELNETGFTTLRIGDANKFLTGLQLYVISYTVEGIVNTFDTHDELNWNIVGNQWAVPIKKISFRINFEGSAGLSKKDVLIYTGKSGSKESDASFNLGSALTGKSTRKFEAYEAFTVALRFNKKYFKPFWKITDIKTNIEIKDNGACNVFETVVVKYNIHGNGFTYKIPKYRTNENGEKEKLFLKYPSAKENGASRRSKLKKDTENHILHVGNNYSSKMLLGFDTVQIYYELWGSVYSENSEMFFEWDFFKNRTQNISVNQKMIMRLPENGNLTENEISETNLKNSSLFKFDKYLKFERKYSKDILKLKLKIPGNLVPSILPIAYVKNAQFYAITNLNAEIEITKNKEVRIKENVKIALVSGFAQGFQHHLNFTSESSYEPYYSSTNFDKISVDRKAIFDEYYKPLVYNITKEEKGFFSYGSVFLWTEGAFDTFERFPTFSFGYDLYDIICKTDSGALITIPLYVGAEYIYDGKCSISLPGKITKEKVKCFIHNGEISKKVDFKIIDNKYVIDLESLSENSSYLSVTILFPEEYVSGSIFTKEVELFYMNNPFLLIPPIVFLFLFVIWYFLGRDKKHTLVVRYNPPENVTPAEAGLLWDDKLHKRDMVSLIYYWASKGYLEMIQGSFKSITLKKLAHLPKDSKQFEKTIFNALFTSSAIGSLTAISTLKTTFAKQFKIAFKEMKRYSRKEGFYSGFANFLSYLFVIISFITIIIATIIYMAEDNTSEIVVSLFLSAVIAYAFGKIMIKKSLHASKIYSEIQGFKEFIVKAELSRLKELSTENPKYFEETIAYAIILGYGRVWAEKFSGLLTEAPSWYKAHDNKEAFDTTIFTRTLVESMYKMENSFNYKPPKPKRTYSSSSYSSSSSSSSSSWSSSWSKSSSSSSSSSWSGSSSFSSGGGSAGGGYGGGGGSSW